MNQLALGAFIPFAVAAIAYALRGFRASFSLLLATPMAMALGAIWAVVPDLPRLAGRMDIYGRLASDPRTDIFFWHYTIDRIEAFSPWPNALTVFMLAGLILAAWRELRFAERE